MNKPDIKLICEMDNKLEWWAMVLFAEISEMVSAHPKCDESVYAFIQIKVEEFPKLVVQRSLELAKEKAEATK